MLSTRHPAREEIASLSSGHYYNSIAEWWRCLVATLGEYDLLPSSPDCPNVYNDEGRSVVGIENKKGEEVSRLAFTWYRMPSFRWEIVNYLT